MASTPKPTNSEIKVDDLLRLKLHERPDEAFWGQFDRELRERMLQSLVKKDPLHVQLLRALTGRAAQSLGLAGAAAAFALIAVTQTAERNTRSGGQQLASAALDPHLQLVSATTDTPAALGMHTEKMDYAIDTITAEIAEDSFQRDFGMDRMQVASFDRAAYSVQDVMSRPASHAVTLASLASSGAFDPTDPADASFCMLGFDSMGPKPDCTSEPSDALALQQRLVSIFEQTRTRLFVSRQPTKPPKDPPVMARG